MRRWRVEEGAWEREEEEGREGVMLGRRWVNK